jgi:glycosyltransferase involved in cell wall biosynthesis
LQLTSSYADNDLYRSLFRALRQYGVQSTVHCAPNHACPANPNEEDGVFISYCFTKFDRLFFHLKHRKVLADVEKYIDFSKIDIIHAHTSFSNGYIARKLSEKYGIPYIVAVRSTDIHFFYKKIIWLRRLGRSVMHDAKRLIFLSPSYEKQAIGMIAPRGKEKAFSAKSVVIPNGIDAFWQGNKAAKPHPANSSRIKLIFAGQLIKRKNIETTLLACRQLIAEGYDVRLTIAGEIIDAKYQKIAEKNPFVEYFPKQAKAQLLDLYRRSDVFVMPSVHETFGLVYAEAMSQGLPVIYSKDQGFDGQFPDGTVGYSAASKNPKDIVSAVKKIYENYEEISKNCISNAGKFDWDRIALDYRKIYEENAGR